MTDKNQNAQDTDINTSEKTQTTSTKKSSKKKHNKKQNKNSQDQTIDETDHAPDQPQEPQEQNDNKQQKEAQLSQAAEKEPEVNHQTKQAIIPKDVNDSPNQIAKSESQTQNLQKQQVSLPIPVPEQKQISVKNDLSFSPTVNASSNESHIIQNNGPQRFDDKQAKQEAMRMSEFRRKHIIFPQKQHQQVLNHQPLANKVLAETFSSVREKFHHSHQQQPQYVDIDQSRMISATTVSKKKQNFRLFREWNENRSKSLQCYAFVVQNFLKGAETKIKQSFQNLQIFITFFKQRANQQQKYSSQPVIDAGYTLTQNEIGSTAFHDCSSVMKQIGQFNLQRCKKIQNFAYLIKKNILSDILQNHANKSKQGLISLKEKLTAVRNAINETQGVIARKTVQLCSFVEDRPPTPQAPKDYYFSQISFLRHASQVSSMFRKYGELTYSYYRTAVELEKQRIDIVKSAIKIYIQGLVQTYQFTTSKSIQDKLNTTNSQPVQNIYDISGLLDSKLQEFIKTQLRMESIQQLTTNQLEKYLQSLEFVPFSSRLLILKQFKTVNVRKDAPNETCNVIITVDKFLHIFLNTEGASIYSKPSQIFRIDQNLRVNRQGSIVEVAKTHERKGVISYILWEPPVLVKYLIQFPKDDSAIQFSDCIRKLL